MALLDITDLAIAFIQRSGAAVSVMSGVSLHVKAGEAVGIYGDSGSGKTTLARAVLGLLPASARCSGQVCFEQRDLLSLSPAVMRWIRGARISLIMQEPWSALCPVRTIGQQIADVFCAHNTCSRSQAMEEAGRILRVVLGGVSPFRIARSFPHQISGGERQRAVIATSLCCRPALLIADEPTSSLDSVTQLEVLGVLRRCREHFGMSMLVISHDLGVLSYIADRTVRLQRGNIRNG